jgi:flagellar motor switch protein FliN/FliY
MADEPNRTADPTAPPTDAPVPEPAASDAQAGAPAEPAAVPDAGTGEVARAAALEAQAGAAADAPAAGAAALDGSVVPSADIQRAGDSDELEARSTPGADGAVGAAVAAIAPDGAAVFAEPDLAESQTGPVLATIDLLDDVELEVTVELGRAEMYIEDVLRLGVGSVVELDRLAGDPVDIFVNKRLVARGEVLVLNDNFCVRINDIVSPIPELAK